MKDITKTKKNADVSAGAGSAALIQEIQVLDKAEWQGYMLDFAYTSGSYYDVAVNRNGDDFSAAFIKKPFENIFVNPNVTYDTLYQPHWEGATAYGILREGSLIAVIETWAEQWSNRLRVTELWVDRQYYRHGIGTALMNIAKEQAKRENRRAVILETQSCNASAIAFYLAQGFTLIGFDACCYGNRDMERHEVRMEMGYFL